jgi:hypothetical protein
VSRVLFIHMMLHKHLQSVISADLFVPISIHAAARVDNYILPITITPPKLSPSTAAAGFPAKFSDGASLSFLSFGVEDINLFII